MNAYKDKTFSYNPTLFSMKKNESCKKSADRHFQQPFYSSSASSNILFHSFIATNDINFVFLQNITI